MNMLRTWRKKKGISAGEAAKRVGVSAVHWFRMENGSRSIAADKVLAVEALTGISRHDLRPDIFGEKAA